MRKRYPPRLDPAEADAQALSLLLPSERPQAPSSTVTAGSLSDLVEAGFLFRIREDYNPDEERDAVGRYTGSGYAVNAMIRDPGGIGTMSPSAEAMVGHVDDAIAQSTTTEDMVVYRGVDADVASQLTPGTTFTDPGFTSTSVDPAIGQRYVDIYSKGAGSVVQIEVPSGSNALDVQSALSKQDPEREVLLPRGSSFDVTHVSDDGVIHARLS